MALICECEHNRKNHEVGHRLSDGVVGSCKEKDCKCKKYHHNKESIEKRNSILVYCGFILSMIIIISIVGYLATTFVVNNLTDLVDIKDKYIYKKYYLNGTLVKDDSKYTAKDSFTTGINATVGFIFFIGSAFGSMFSITAVYDNKYRRLINE